MRRRRGPGSAHHDASVPPPRVRTSRIRSSAPGAARRAARPGPTPLSRTRAAERGTRITPTTTKSAPDSGPTGSLWRSRSQRRQPGAARCFGPRAGAAVPGLSPGTGAVGGGKFGVGGGGSVLGALAGEIAERADLGTAPELGDQGHYLVRQAVCSRPARPGPR